MRTRNLTVAVAAVAVILLLLGGYLYLMPQPTTPTSVSGGANVNVDASSSGTAYPWAAPQGPVQGVEPSVAVGAGGAVGVAWIGLSASHPVVYPNSSLSFRSQILFAHSTDGSASFSPPVQVSNSSDPISYDCFDPSTAISSNGTVAYVAYACLQNSGVASSIFLAAGKEGASGTFAFVQHIISVGVGFERPWVGISASGLPYLVWDSGYLAYWGTVGSSLTISGTPSFNTFPTTYGWITGAAMFGNGTIVATAYGYSRPGLTNSTVSVLYAKLDHSQNSGPLVWTHLADLAVSSNLYHGATENYLPGPALAISPGGSAYVAYAGDDGHTLMLTYQASGAASWTAPVTLQSNPTGMVELPALAVSPSGNAVGVAWMGNSTGHWDAYASVYVPSTSKFLAPVNLSSADGYPSGLLVWHGDFIATAFSSGSNFVVTWADGRGAPDYYGYGHVYSSIVTVA